MVNNLRMCSDCHSLGKQQEAASYKERNFHSAARAGRFSHHVGSVSSGETKIPSLVFLREMHYRGQPQ
ncbi:hypothetical protein ACFX1X_012789 [Malus domestica]